MNRDIMNNENSSGNLVRPRDGRILGGVCAGLAQKLNLDVSLVRLVSALAVIFTGVGPFAYLAAWLVIPEEGKNTTGLDQVVTGAKERWSNYQATKTSSSSDQPQRPHQPGAPQDPGETFNPYN